MGICASICPKRGSEILKLPDDSESLFRTENMTTEAMIRTQVPPTPLLKEINFAAINEDAGNDDGPDLSEGAVNAILEEESENDA
jgi:hypothetical protein